jgi:flagellar biogenesis protein FliO
LPALILLAAVPASAQVGPSVADMRTAASPPAHTPRSASEIEAELRAIDADLRAALTVGKAETAPAATPRTPLGAPPPGPEPRTALVDPNARQPDRHGGARTMFALAGVLLLVFGLAWVYKRFARATGGLAGSIGAGGRAPAGLVEVLARYPLASRHTLVVLRFDRRVLLCSMTGSSRSAGAGMSVLCELDDAEDVASVLVKARDEAGESIARSFERSLRAAERSAEGVLDAEPIRVARAAPDVAGPHAPRSRTTEHASLRRGLEAIWTGGVGARR